MVNFMFCEHYLNRKKKKGKKKSVLEISSLHTTNQGLQFKFQNPQLVLVQPIQGPRLSKTETTGVFLIPPMCTPTKVTKSPGLPDLGGVPGPHSASHFTSHHGCKSLMCLQLCWISPKPCVCSFLFTHFLPSLPIYKLLSPILSQLTCHLLQEAISGLPRGELIPPENFPTQ